MNSIITMAAINLAAILALCAMYVTRRRNLVVSYLIINIRYTVTDRNRHAASGALPTTVAASGTITDSSGATVAQYTAVKNAASLTVAGEKVAEGGNLHGERQRF